MIVSNRDKLLPTTMRTNKSNKSLNTYTNKQHNLVSRVMFVSLLCIFVCTGVLFIYYESDITHIQHSATPSITHHIFNYKHHSSIHPRQLQQYSYNDIPQLSTATACNMDYSGNYSGCTECTKYKPDPVMTNKTRDERTKLHEFQSTVQSYHKLAHKYFIPDSRGIVSSVGTAWDAESAYSQIHQLRYYFNTTIPIQLFHLPGEISLIEKSKLQSLPEVEVIDLTDSSLYAPASEEQAKTTGRKYFVKPTAIINSKFEHVMWLDSDNIILADPTYLFDLPQYQYTTALLWPDNYMWNVGSDANPPKYFWTGGVFSHNPIFQVLGITCISDENAGESGQMIVNKQLGWLALNTINYMAINHRYYMDELQLLGDKDFFRLVWRSLQLPYFQIRMPWHLAGFMHGHDRFCGLGMVQHDPDNNIVFLHANGLKTQTHIGWSTSPFTHLNRFAHVSSQTTFGGNGCGLILHGNNQTNTYTQEMDDDMKAAFEAYKRGASSY